MSINNCYPLLRYPPSGQEYFVTLNTTVSCTCTQATLSNFLCPPLTTSKTLSLNPFRTLPTIALNLSPNSWNIPPPPRAVEGTLGSNGSPPKILARGSSNGVGELVEEGALDSREHGVEIISDGSSDVAKPTTQFLGKKRLLSRT